MQKNKTLPPKEKEVEKTIIKGLRWYGIYCQKIQSGASWIKSRNKRGKEVSYQVTYADTGTPDVFCCVPVRITQDMVGKTFGAFVAVEVKRDEAQIRRWEKQKDLRANQQLGEMEKVMSAGGLTILSCSLPDVLKCLEENNYFKLKSNNEKI